MFANTTRPASGDRDERAAIVTPGWRTPPGRPKEHRAMHPTSRSQPRPTPISQHRHYQERHAMTYQPLTYMHAEARRQHMLAEAEHERTIAQARATTRTDRGSAAIAALRRQIGTALVQTGERLQGVRVAGAAEPELDANPTVGIPRLAR